MDVSQPTTSCCVTLVHYPLLWSIALQSENGGGKQEVEVALGMDLPGTQSPWSSLKEGGHVTSPNRVTDILMGESQGHRVTPETLPSWEADWIDRLGLRPLFPSLPFPLPSQVGSRRPTGPRADRRRAGRVSHGHREKGAHCLLKPNQGGWGHNAGDSFARNRHAFLPPTAAKGATGFDSLPFHPKQMINK